MPRSNAVATENTEDLMDDVHFEDWDIVSEPLGEKLRWNVGTSLIAVFKGIELFELDDKKDGFTESPAAIFENTDGKYWCWLPFQLSRILRGKGAVKVEPGDTVYIKCTGEEKLSNGDDMNPIKQFEVRVKPKTAK